MPVSWPILPSILLTQDLCQFKQFLRQECAATINFALNSHPRREMKWLKLSASSVMLAIVMTHVCLQVRNNAVQNVYNPKMGTKLKKLLQELA